MLVATILFTLATAGDAPDVRAFAETIMREVGTPPGMAIAVVKGDRIILEQSYGLRDVESSLPVTRDTRFYIASSTKSFTAAAAKLLAHEGKLDLDGPLTKAIPGLQLNQPLAADRISVRDLLTHRSGFTNGAVNMRTAMAGNMSDEEILTNLARWSQAGPIGFRYSNAAYVVAGLAVEHAAKSSWQEVLRDRIFVPLGMTSTTAMMRELEGKPVARSYFDEAPGKFRRTAGKTDATMHAAGGVFSTAGDLGRWVIANLNEGAIDGQQVLPKRVVRELHAPQVNFSSSWGPMQRFAYGLGWNLADYEGDLVVHHFGGFGGAYAHISFMPDRDLGVVALSNGGGRVADTMAYYLYDRLLSKPGLDAKYDKIIADLKERAKKTRSERAAVEEKKRAAAARKPSRNLEQYAGAYFSERLGEIAVVVDGNRLMARMGVLDVPLFPESDDKFFVDWGGDGELEGISFVFDGDGPAQVLDWDGRKFDRTKAGSATRSSSSRRE